MSKKKEQWKVPVILDADKRSAVVELYVNGGRSSKSIAEEFGICDATVCNFVRKSGFSPKRDNRERVFSDLQKQDMVRLYSEWRWSLLEIAELYDVTISVIHNHLKKLGAQMRPPASGEKNPPRGEKHFRWNGGRSINAGGYVVIPSGRRKHYLLEHRVLMSRHLLETNPSHPALNEEGYLKRNWIVHHRNGIKSDNRLENLEVMQINKHHPHLHCHQRITELELQVSALKARVADLESQMKGASCAQ